MANKVPMRFNTIGNYHRFRRLPPPEHPLVSLLKFEDIELKDDEPESLVFGFFTIALRRHSGAKFKYGQQEYDHNEGIMLFMAPEQVFGIETYDKNPLGGY